jgi:hypothetical protein
MRQSGVAVVMVLNYLIYVYEDDVSVDFINGIVKAQTISAMDKGVEFGMTPEHVEAILGPPKAIVETRK